MPVITPLAVHTMHTLLVPVMKGTDLQVSATMATVSLSLHQ